MTNQRQPENESVVTAFVDVVSAAQKVIVDRIELVLVEARATLSRTASSALFAGLGVLFFSVGWCALNGVVVLLLDPVLLRTASLALIGAINVGLALAMLAIARRRVLRARPHRRPQAGQRQIAVAHNGHAVADEPRAVHGAAGQV